MFANDNNPYSDVWPGYADVDDSVSQVVATQDFASLLTSREAQVLQLIVSGKSNKEIARMIFRTERTVEYHRNRLMHKIGAHNAAELVKRAIAMGFV